MIDAAAATPRQKLLIVEPYKVDGANRKLLTGTGRTLVAVDTVGAGQYEMGLIVQGQSARLTPDTTYPTVDAPILGLPDLVPADPFHLFRHPTAPNT